MSFRPVLPHLLATESQLTRLFADAVPPGCCSSGAADSLTSKTTFFFQLTLAAAPASVNGGRWKAEEGRDGKERDDQHTVGQGAGDGC